MHLSVTIIILAITAIVSFMVFSNEKLRSDLIFYPPAIHKDKQWYRFITCGFIHADMVHLAFNMYAFYMFGEWVENDFVVLFGFKGYILYALLYFSALVFCLLPTYQKHKDDYYYSSLGASGAVSAVVFAFVILHPMEKIGLMFLPKELGLPAFLFGAIYLIVSNVLEKRNSDNINHSAHFWGAIYGIAFLIVCCNLFSSYKPLHMLVEQVQMYFQAKFS